MQVAGKNSKVFTLRLLIALSLLLSFSACPGSKELKLAQIDEQAGRLESAYEHYSLHLQKKPTDLTALKARAAVSDKIARTTSEEVRKSLETLQDPTVSQLEELKTRLTAKKEYGGDKYIEPVVLEIENRIRTAQKATDALAKQFQDAIWKRDISLSQDLFLKMRDSNPNYPALDAMEEALASLLSSNLESRLERLLVEGDIRTVRAELEKLKKIRLSASHMTALLEKADKTFSEQVKIRVQEDIKAKRYFQAYQFIRASGQEEFFASGLLAIREKGGRFYARQAKRRKQRGKLYRAYLEAMKGYELDPTASGILELHRDIRDQLTGKLQRYIAVTAFGAPKLQPDLGSQFSDALISYLFRELPYGTNILERQKIDLVLAERQRDYKKASEILNVDLIVTGNVSVLEVEHQENDKSAIVKAQVGEEKKVNPEYEALAQIHGNKIGRLKNIPPAVISVPKYEFIKYQKGESTVKGFATVSARIFEAKKGGIIYAQEFNAKVSKSDTHQQGVPGTEIFDDPLELPTDIEVKEMLRSQIVEEFGEVVKEVFARRKGQFAKDAKYYLSRKEPGKAIRSLALGHLYAIKSKLSEEDADFQELMKLILVRTERDFL